MSSEIKLLSCPFCGGEARLINGIPKINYIKCKRCQTMTSSSEVIERVIELWNTRKPIDRIMKQLENEKFELEDCRYDVDLNTTIDMAIAIIRTVSK